MNDAVKGKQIIPALLQVMIFVVLLLTLSVPAYGILQVSSVPMSFPPASHSSVAPGFDNFS
jgi:hypothetical protein